MRLSVNIDHVATMREARSTDEPDPVRAAEAAERAGADGITCHLREDRRHIQDADVRALKASIRTVLNLELAQHPEIVRLACRVRPFQATLVPERRREITTEGGLAGGGGGRGAGGVGGRGRGGRSGRASPRRGCGRRGGGAGGRGGGRDARRRVGGGTGRGVAARGGGEEREGRWGPTADSLGR